MIEPEFTLPQIRRLVKKDYQSHIARNLKAALAHIEIAKQKSITNKKMMWYDAEIKKPDHGQEIIFIDAIGMFKGVFYSKYQGVVYVNGSRKDQVRWESIHEWIEYPDRKL